MKRARSDRSPLTNPRKKSRRCADEKESILIDACEYGHVDQVSLLLDAGIDVHVSYDLPLRRACEHGHAKVVKLLLDAGAYVNALECPLRHASKNGHAEVVSLLLVHGADVHVGVEEALRWSCKNGHAEVVSILLGAGADPNIRFGNYFQEIEHVEVVALLLKHGLDVHANDDHALKWATDRGYTDVVEVLLKNGADARCGNGYPIINSWKPEITSLLLEYGADPNVHDGRALLLACYMCRVDKVSVLLGGGVDVHLRNDAAMGYALLGGNVEIVYMLLSAGIHPNKCPKQMMERVKQYACDQMKDIDLPTSLKKYVICNYLIGDC